MLNKLKLRLVIDAEYELNGESPSRMVANLNNAAHYLNAEGLITGETNAELEEYAFHVETVT